MIDYLWVPLNMNIWTLGIVCTFCVSVRGPGDVFAYFASLTTRATKVPLAREVCRAQTPRSSPSRVRRATRVVADLLAATANPVHPSNYNRDRVEEMAIRLVPVGFDVLAVV